MENNNYKIKYSVVVPCYNSELFLDNYVIKLKILKTNYEIILIDDCSTDKTVQLAIELNKNKNIKVFANQKNYGQLASTLFGIKRVLENLFSLLMMTYSTTLIILEN